MPNPTPTPTAPQSTFPASTPLLAPSSAAPSSSTSSWPWSLIGLLVILLVVVTVVVRRSRQAARAREAQLATAVSESTWLAHELLPDALSAPGAPERRATWTAYRPRVDALMNVLGEAALSASPERREGVRNLWDAVQELTFTMDTYAATGRDDPTGLDAVRQAQRRLEVALHAVQRGTAIRP